MELKDRLKRLRLEKGVTQQELADAVFVSRSAVAKWENGLGLPSKVSYEALLIYFGITAEEFPMHETERVTVEKNRRIRGLWQTVSMLSAVLVLVVSVCFFYAFEHGYGFTSQMAAGEHWRGESVIQTPRYDFYWYSLAPEDDPICMIDGFCVVEKIPLGYQRIDADSYMHEVISDDGLWGGRLYSFQQKDGWHHIFRSHLHIVSYDEPMQVVLFDTVRVKEDLYPVEYYSYFVTDFELTEFWGDDRHFTVK